MAEKSWYSWSYSRLATGETTDSEASYDEERQGGDYDSSSSCWRRSSKNRFQKKFPRPTKTTLVLVLIDVLIVGLLVYTLEPLITLLRRNEDLFAPRVSLSQHDDIPANATWPDRKIPRILHQTCANDTIPAKWVESQRSCRHTYADWEYKLWTDDTARELIAAEFPWFLDSWNNYAFPIQRADSIRYFVLYQYGGLYLDMDTWCNETIPLHQIESGSTAHTAVFKSTEPTGVTNDLMITSAKHPVYASVVAKLPFYYGLTRFWARLLPYVNIMLSSGPMFLTLVVKDYLLDQPSLPSPAIQVVTPEELTPFITDLESSTWHRADAKLLMWLGHRPWSWFTLGAIGTLAGLLVLNYLMVLVWNALPRKCKIPSVAYVVKQAKIA